MRKLERMIRKARNRGGSGKALAVLLALLVGLWLAAATGTRQPGSGMTFDGFEAGVARSGCGLMLAASCSARMLLEPAILARHIEWKPLGVGKLPYRPARFGFRQ